MIFQGEPVHVALYKGTSLLSRLIRWWTRYPESHAAWVLPDSTVVEAWSGGVRHVESIHALHKPGTTVDLYTLENLSPFIRDEISLLIHRQEGKPYDYWGIFGFILHKDIENPKAWFCSELIVAMCEKAGYPLFRPAIPAYKVPPGLMKGSLLMRKVGTVVTTSVDEPVVPKEKKEEDSVMKKIGLVLVGLAALALTGCATSNGAKVAEETRRAYESFVNQPRTYEALAIDGTNLTFTITGATRIAMTAPHTPLSAIPQDPDTAMRLVDALKNTVLGGLGIYTLGRIATQEAPAPVIVEQPKPIIISE